MPFIYHRVLFAAAWTSVRGTGGNSCDRIILRDTHDKCISSHSTLACRARLTLLSLSLSVLQTERYVTVAYLPSLITRKHHDTSILPVHPLPSPTDPLLVNSSFIHLVRAYFYLPAGKCDVAYHGISSFGIISRIVRRGKSRHEFCFSAPRRTGAPGERASSRRLLGNSLLLHTVWYQCVSLQNVT